MSSPPPKKQQADAAARAEITKRLLALERRKIELPWPAACRRPAVLEARHGAPAPWHVHSDPIGRELNTHATNTKGHPLDGLSHLVVKFGD